MRSTRGRIGVGFVLVSTLVGACVAGEEKDEFAAEAVARPEAAVRDARDASDVVLAVRTQLERGFGKANIQLPGARTPRVSIGNFHVVGSRTVADTETFSLNGLPTEMPKARADVDLPSRADGAFRLRDQRSGLSIDVGLWGATTSAREDSSGYVVYRYGYVGGGHIVHRPTSAGTEDYVFFPETLPDTPELRYDVALGEGVAGLRLVDRTLEMLDAEGTPRLRMAPPYAVDGEGRRLAVGVAIEGCAYDSSGVVPWRRPTVDPGAKHCTVHLSWSADAKAPLVVDPAWSHTSDMKITRFRHTSVALQLPSIQNPQITFPGVLVAGGDNGVPGQATDSVEIYDEKTDTWTATGSMKAPRTEHAMVVASGGNNLYVIGGRNGGTATHAVDKYSVSGGYWGTLPALGLARWGHTATMVESGKILVTGGFTQNDTPTNSAELYLQDAGVWKWITLPEMAMPRGGHSAVAIDSNLKFVILIGGDTGAQGATNLIEQCDILLGKCGLPGPPAMIKARAYHVAFRAEAKLFVFGGYPYSETAEVFDPGMGNTWTLLPSMKTGRSFFSISPMQPINSFRYLVTGGLGAGDAPQKSAEIFDAPTKSWATDPVIPEMLTPRAFHTSALLSDGRVMVMGGADGLQAEIIHCANDDECGTNSGNYCSKEGVCTLRKDQGAPCDAKADCWDGNCSMCQTGLCVDGYCCDSPCEGQCETCNGAGLGGKPGQCLPMTGPPVTGTLTQRVACNGEGLCGGSCNGVTREACTYPQGNTCSTGCKDGKFQSLTCNGEGSCEAIAFEQTCAPYACDDKEQQCNTTCTPPTNPGDKTGCDDETSVCNADNQCISRPTKCKDDTTMVLPDGSELSCETFRCEKGACLTVCDTAYDCAAHPDPKKSYVCDESRKCVEEKFEDTVEIATSCSASQSPNSSRLGWLAALAIAGAFASRRSRARA